jgi:hypothetical protein
MLTYEPSLIVPSVQDLWIDGDGSEKEALLLCCGLVQMGYKHRLGIRLRDSEDALPRSVSTCMRAILSAGGSRFRLV